MFVLFYGAAAYIHLSMPMTFMPVMPDWVPEPYRVIQFTGLCEAAGAVGLLIPRLRWLAGLMLALYAVCVFPVNINTRSMDRPFTAYQICGFITDRACCFSRCWSGGRSMSERSPIGRSRGTLWLGRKDPNKEVEWRLYLTIAIWRLRAGPTERSSACRA